MFKKISLSLLLQIAASGFTFLTTLVIAWISHDEGFGIYSLVYTWVSLLCLIAVWGTDDLLTKQIPHYQHQNNAGHIKGLINWAVGRVWLVSIVAALLFVPVVLWSGWRGVSDYAEYYFWALPCLPFFALMHVYQSSLRAQQHVIAGQLADKIAQPLIFLALLVGFYALTPLVSDQQVILFRVLSFVVTALAAYWLLLRFLPASVRQAAPQTQTNLWESQCRYFTLTTLLYALNTRVDIILLGTFATNPAEIAHYNVALKFSELLQIPFMGITAVLTPMFAKLYAARQQQQLQATYTRATRYIFGLTLAGSIGFLVLGQWLLGWYGNQFSAAYPCLLVLTLARLLHALLGPANYLLMVSDQQRSISYTVLVSTIATIVFHCIAIPNWGIYGAAWASVGGAVVFELGMGWLLYTRLRIVPSVV